MSGDSTDCYIEIWADKDFQGDCVRLVGPAEYATLRFKTHDWGDQIGSLRVGLHAFVLAYEDEDFRDRMVSFGPGEVIADLTELKFDDQIDSMKVIHSLKVLERRSEENEANASGDKGQTAEGQSGSKPGVKRRKARRRRRWK